ncbi:MAG: hypothetical protein R2682_01865 [Pyrinomonadaceae bacterium]
MSVVGTIVVYRCDGLNCRSHIVVQSEKDVDRFGREWLVGGDVDFCSHCRSLEENQLRMKAAWQEPLRRLQSRFSSKKEVRNAA